MGKPHSLRFQAQPLQRAGMQLHAATRSVRLFPLEWRTLRCAAPVLEGAASAAAQHAPFPSDAAPVHPNPRLPCGCIDLQRSPLDDGALRLPEALLLVAPRCVRHIHCKLGLDSDVVLQRDVGDLHKHRLCRWMRFLTPHTRSRLATSVCWPTALKSVASRLLPRHWARLGARSSKSRLQDLRQQPERFGTPSACSQALMCAATHLDILKGPLAEQLDLRGERHAGRRLPHTNRSQASTLQKRPESAPPLLTCRGGFCLRRVFGVDAAIGCTAMHRSRVPCSRNNSGHLQHSAASGVSLTEPGGTDQKQCAVAMTRSAMPLDGARRL